MEVKKHPTYFSMQNCLDTKTEAGIADRFNFCIRWEHFHRWSTGNVMKITEPLGESSTGKLAEVRLERPRTPCVTSVWPWAAPHPSVFLVLPPVQSSVSSAEAGSGPTRSSTASNTTPLRFCVRVNTQISVTSSFSCHRVLKPRCTF